MIKKLIKEIFGSELKGHYVKYSPSTAIENPQMILNEYDRLIVIQEEKINKSSNKDYMVTLGDVICYDMNNALTHEGYDYIAYEQRIILKQLKTKIKNKYKLSMHVKQLNELLKQYENEELEKEKLTKELKEIKEEKEQFEYDIKHLYG
jgi:predicted nuclease with TOPRIM domain